MKCNACGVKLNAGDEYHPPIACVLFEEVPNADVVREVLDILRAASSSAAEGKQGE